MSRLKLKIDLSDFFVDKRRLAYVMTNKKWGHVAELEEHVENMFEVQKVHFTTDDGVFLPSRESIEVLAECSLLKAFMAQELREKRPTEQEAPAAAENGKPGDKRKLNGNGSISSSTPNGPVKKKRRTSEDMTAKALKMSPDYEKSNTNLVPVTSTNCTPNDDKSSPDLSQSVEETVKTRKRQRVRKKGKGQPSCEDPEKSSRLSCVPVPISSSTLRLSKSMSTPNGKHVHFDEDVTLVQGDAETARRSVVFRCRLIEEDSMQPREIAVEGEKPKILIHENILLVEGEKDSSFDGENSSVIEIEDSFLKAPDVLAKAADADVSVASATVEQILPISQPLVGLPKPGDVILFKMFRLSGENTSDMTEFICATCEEVDAEKKKIKCTISDGLDQLEEGSQKCPQVGSQKNNCFEYFLDELMDARVARMT